MGKKELQVGSDNPYIVTLTRPYRFDNVECTSVDLSALDNLSTQSLLDAERIWVMKGNASNQMETSYAYCMEVASLATGNPVEFFTGLPMKDGIAVKGTVQKHFLGLIELPETL